MSSNWRYHAKFFCFGCSKNVLTAHGESCRMDDVMMCRKHSWSQNFNHFFASRFWLNLLKIGMFRSQMMVSKHFSRYKYQIASIVGVEKAKSCFIKFKSKSGLGNRHGFFEFVVCRWWALNRVADTSVMRKELSQQQLRLMRLHDSCNIKCQ